ncbi:MAG: class I SAM-dependent methyltransferase [Solirubrobacteraceae bacterium]
MSLWGQIFARVYDRGMAATEAAGLGDRRAALLANASGTVVEIGAGTGVNLARYPDAVSELVLVEPEGPMLAKLKARVAGSSDSSKARVVQAPAESIPLPDAFADVAVSTLVLCTVADPTAALSELRRVLKPGGRLLFIEHVRADDAAAARTQDRWDPIWRRWGHGCRCNRPTLASIEAAGFAVEQVDHGRTPKAPPIVRPLIAGVAVSPAA